MVPSPVVGKFRINFAFLKLGSTVGPGRPNHRSCLPARSSAVMKRMMSVCLS